MNSKVAVLAILAALAVAVQGSGWEHESYNDDHTDYYAYPKYEFKYGVEDTHTGDIKNQEEHRDGDNVHGHYTVVQPDGRTRVVSYHADKHSGFNADVKYIGEAHHEIQHQQPEYHHEPEHHGWY